MRRGHRAVTAAGAGGTAAATGSHGRAESNASRCVLRMGFAAAPKKVPDRRGVVDTGVVDPVTMASLLLNMPPPSGGKPMLPAVVGRDVGALIDAEQVVRPNDHEHRQRLDTGDGEDVAVRGAMGKTGHGE